MLYFRSHRHSLDMGDINKPSRFTVVYLLIHVMPFLIRWPHHAGHSG